MSATMDALQLIGVGRRAINDPYFDESYEVCKVFQRKGIIVEDEEELCHEVIREFPCHVSQCNAVFKTLLDFEIHYNSCHRYVCAECKKSMANPRLLDIHIQESHDSFFRVLSDKRPMYQCYVSECDLRFQNPRERKEHCLSIHRFPKNYRFDNISPYKEKDENNKMEIDETDDKSAKTKSKKPQLSKNQKIKMFSAKATNAVTKTPSNDTEPPNYACTTKSTSSLVFVPRQVQKSYSKLLTNNQNRERNVLETDDMMALADSLPN